MPQMLPYRLYGEKGDAMKNDRLHIHIPAEIKELLRKLSVEEQRTMTDEIIYLIRKRAEELKIEA
jgi:hypothetical protein